MRDRTSWVDRRLAVDDDVLPLDKFDRAIIVGGGKAAGDLAVAVADRLGGVLPVSGVVSVPGRQTRHHDRIILRGVRDWSRNEVTPEAVRATAEMLRQFEQADGRTLVVAVITGGGSALISQPTIAVERMNSRAHAIAAVGGDIRAVNEYRASVDSIKSGGLARAVQRCPGPPTLVTLCISDVIGDDPAVIASGPTATNPPMHFHVLGNNAVAVDAAGIAAESLGYNHVMRCDVGPQPSAEQAGRQMVHAMSAMRPPTSRAAAVQHDALITGGEPTVRLSDRSTRGRGGRNGQLVLAALVELRQRFIHFPPLTLLSAGTDGEDGTSDSAGAWIDPAVDARARELRLDPADYLAHHNSHEFFDRCGGLLQTGPTGTNVCDVRVATWSR